VSARPCTVCGSDIEASVPLWLNYDEAEGWSVYGIADEAAKVSCAGNGHDQMTQELGDSLTAFIEAAFPGTSWRDTDPRRKAEA
jgi:hypothetical protein